MVLFLSQISMNSVQENAPAKVPSAFHFSVKTFRPIETEHLNQKIRFTKKNLICSLDLPINFVVLFYQPHHFGFFGTIHLRATLNRLAQRAKVYVLGVSLITRRS